MELNRRTIAFAFVLSLSAIPLWAQSAGVRLSPDPFYLTLASIPDPVPVPDLIHASLVMSGAGPGAVARDTNRLNAIIAEVKRSVGAIQDPYARGNALLVYMHTHLLTSYSEWQTRMDLLLDTGEFNCVSSAVLYMILGRSIGLSVEGVSTPDHAFCTVDLGGRNVDVETTNQYGFDPGTKRSFHDAFGNTGFTYVPPGDYALRTPTDEKGLLAFILQNRMSILERRLQFGEAIGLSADRYALLGTQAAFADLANEIGNECAALNNANHYLQALNLLAETRRSYGPIAKLSSLSAGLVNNQVLRLVDAQQFSEAASFIQARVADGTITSAQAMPLAGIVAQRRLYETSRTQPFDVAVAAVRRSYAEGAITPDTYRSFIVSLYGQRAQGLASSQDYLGAVKVLDAALALVGSDAQVSRGREIYLQDYVAVVHNHFASLFNVRDYVQAKKVLSAGLAQLPGNQTFLQDEVLLRSAAGG